jgi:hypothetical protein
MKLHLVDDHVQSNMGWSQVSCEFEQIYTLLLSSTNLQSFLFQASVMNWWADKMVKTVQAHRSEGHRKMASVATGRYRLLQVATEPCDKPISALPIYLNFAAT